MLLTPRQPIEHRIWLYFKGKQTKQTTVSFRMRSVPQPTFDHQSAMPEKLHLTEFHFITDYSIKFMKGMNGFGNILPYKTRLPSLRSYLAIMKR